MTPSVSVRARPMALPARPIGLKTAPKVAGAPAKVAASVPSKLKIEPIGKTGFNVSHHFGPGVSGGISSPRNYIFTASDKMLNHVRKTAAVMKPFLKIKKGHPLG